MFKEPEMPSIFLRLIRRIYTKWINYQQDKLYWNHADQIKIGPPPIYKKKRGKRHAG